MTNEQRKTILEYLKISSKDGKWHIKTNDTDDQWLLTPDLIPVDCETGDCAEHNKRLVDPWLMEQLANKLAKKVGKREKLDSKPVTKKEKLERHLNKKRDIKEENDESVDANAIRLIADKEEPAYDIMKANSSRLHACETILTQFNFEGRLFMINRFCYGLFINDMNYAICGKLGRVLVKSADKDKLIKGLKFTTHNRLHSDCFNVHHHCVDKTLELATQKDIQAIDDYFEKITHEIVIMFKNNPKACAVYAGSWS